MASRCPIMMHRNSSASEASTSPSNNMRNPSSQYNTNEYEQTTANAEYTMDVFQQQTPSETGTPHSRSLRRLGGGGNNDSSVNLGSPPVGVAGLLRGGPLNTLEDDVRSEVSGGTGSTTDDTRDPFYNCVADIIAASAENNNMQHHSAQQQRPVYAPQDEDSSELTSVASNSVRHQIANLFQSFSSRSATGLIFADLFKQRILHVNEAGQRILGRLDLVGQALEVLLPHEQREDHPGRVQEYIERYRSEFRRSGQVTESRIIDDPQIRHVRMVRMQDSREALFDASIHLHSVRLSCESIVQPARIMALEFQDIGNQQKDSQDVKVLRSALAHVSEGVVIADLAGKIEWMNAAAEVLTGYSLKALVDKRASVSIFVTPEFHDRHESYLHHFHQKRLAALGDAQVCTESHEVVLQRRDNMRTAHGYESIQLRVEVVFNKLIGYLKSTKEFIPREDFETERLKLLLPTPIVRKISAEPGREITSFHWEFPQTSILFTDVKGFSTWARNQSVKNVHDRMQPMFREFEKITQSFGGELIHRIGDAIMVIFGFNGHPRHHARLAVACATELQLWAADNEFKVRIGINSGHIGAGIYGAPNGRPGFDAWGPNVNLAKRLEEHGVAGAVHLSQSVVDAVGTHFRHVTDKVLKKRQLKGVKGTDGGILETYLLQVSRADQSHLGSTQTDAGDVNDASNSLPDDFLQLVNFQRAEYSKWLRRQEETAQRLAELAKGRRR